MSQAGELTVAARLMELFAGHANAYGTHGAPVQKGLKWEIKSTAKTVRAPVTEQLWQDHLDGKKPLGIIPIREDDTCVWGSIDVDDYNRDLLNIIDQVEREQLPLVPGRSKSGGLHLFLFLSAPVAAAKLQTALKSMALKLNLPTSEIFPKQTTITSDNKAIGNWMVMPYFGSTYDGKLREQVGLRKTGAELTAEQFLRYAELHRVPPETLNPWLNPKATRTTTLIRGGRRTEPAEPFADGPVCLQTLARIGVTKGGQNDTLFNMGLYYKRADPDHWGDRLLTANNTFLQPEPGDTRVLQEMIRRLQGTSPLHRYGCKKEPLVSHCDAHACRLRTFGVGTTDGGEARIPRIISLTKENAEPTVWHVGINELPVMQLASEELLTYKNFRATYFDRLGQLFLAMSQNDWEEKLLSPALVNITEIEVPPELKFEGRVKGLLEEYLTNKSRGKDRNSLLLDKAWENEEEGRYYFQMKSFIKFIVTAQNSIREADASKIAHLITKKFDGGWKRVKVLGKNIGCYWLPSNMFEDKDPITLPPAEGEPI